MAIVKFYCDSGANIHSCRDSGELDTVHDLGLEEGEWEAYSEDEKFEVTKEWANDGLEIYYEEQTTPPTGGKE